MKIIDVVGFIKVNNPADLGLIIPGMMDLLAEKVNAPKDPFRSYIKAPSEDATICINDITTALEESLLNNPGHGYEIKLVNENYRYVFREEDIPYWKTYTYDNMIIMCRAPRTLTRRQLDKMDAFCLNWGIYSEKGLNKEASSQTKKGIQNLLKKPILEDKPLSIDKLQCLRRTSATLDEWAQDNDPVNHPNHYCQNGLESIDVIKAFTSDLNGIEAFCAGNAIKYILRFNHKNGEQDLDKAIWYINKLKEEKYHNKKTEEKEGD